MDNKAIKDEAMEMDFEPQAQTQPHHWQAEGLVGQASLLHAFEKQQQCLREAVQNEFDKRLPLATHAASSCSGVAKQVFLPIMTGSGTRIVKLPPRWVQYY